MGKIEEIKDGYIYNLMIEITRDCNFSCAHCLRGPSQKQDLDLSKLREFLYDNNVTTIGNLTITGGEPLSKPKLIQDLAYDLRSMNLEIDSCYIATNGSYFNYESFSALSSLYNSINDGICIEISNSSYHKEERKRLNITNILTDKESIYLSLREQEYLNDFSEDEDFEYSLDLKLESIYYLLNQEDFDICLDHRTYNNLIEEGRGHKVGGFLEAKESEDLIYFSAKNEIIINNCDLSFKSMRKKKLFKI